MNHPDTAQATKFRKSLTKARQEMSALELSVQHSEAARKATQEALESAQSSLEAERRFAQAGWGAFVLAALLVYLLGTTHPGCI